MQVGRKCSSYYLRAYTGIFDGLNQRGGECSTGALSEQREPRKSLRCRWLCGTGSDADERLKVKPWRSWWHAFDGGQLRAPAYRTILRLASCSQHYLYKIGLLVLRLAPRSKMNFIGFSCTDKPGSETETLTR